MKIAVRHFVNLDGQLEETEYDTHTHLPVMSLLIHLQRLRVSSPPVNLWTVK